MKTLKITLLIMVCAISKTYSQTTPTILIDGQPVLAASSSNFPYWMKSGQTLAIGSNVVSISVLQYNIAPATTGGNSLQFESVEQVTSVSTVPSGKAWKVESVALMPSASAFSGDNLGSHVAATDLNMNNYKVINMVNPVNLEDAVNAATLQKGNLVYASDNGTANNYSVTLSPAPLAYVPGMIVNFKVSNANTGASTINVNSLGAKSIKKQVNVDVVLGDIAANQLMSVIYDGTNFQMISPVAASSGLGAVNLYSATSWQSSSSSNEWENISTLSYTIPQTGLYQVLCYYEGMAACCGTQGDQRIAVGSVTSEKATLTAYSTSYENHTLICMGNLSTGNVVYLQNKNANNSGGYKNTIKNIRFSIIKLN